MMQSGTGTPEELENREELMTRRPSTLQGARLTLTTGKGPERGVLVLFMLVLLTVATGCSREAPYDLILEGGRLVDGSGAQAFEADLAISGGRIAAIGDLAAARAVERIDVSGKVVAPGFIDVHSHADQGLVDPELRTNEGFLTQGVTTAVFGVDGAYPPGRIDELKEIFARQGVGTHYAFYVGHNGVRSQVMGLEERAPSAAELDQMRGLVRSAMEAGAHGLSSGLMYLPGNFATTDEVVALAEVVAEFGGVYDSHIRDPAGDLVESIAECLAIGERSGVAPHPAHHKAPGARNFGKAREISALIAEARERGQKVTVDQYPYDGAATARMIEVIVPTEDLDVEAAWRAAMDPSLSPEQARRQLEQVASLWLQALSDPAQRARLRQRTEEPPPEVFSWVKAVGYESWRIVVSDAHPDWVGRMFTDVAQEEALSPFDLIVRLIEDDGPVAKITLGACLEDDVAYLMTRPWTMIASDGTITGFEGGGGHPRSRGTFPRVLGRYVREQGLLTLEQAINKMTGMPAAFLQMKDRGLLREGLVADVTVFDPERVIDRSTWREPSLLSEGIELVLVAGAKALADGAVTGELAGQYIAFGGSSGDGGVSTTL